MKVTWCWRNLSPSLSCLLPFRFLEGEEKEGGKHDCFWFRGKTKGTQQALSVWFGDLVGTEDLLSWPTTPSTAKELESNIPLPSRGTWSRHDAWPNTGKKSTLPRANSRTLKSVLKGHPFEFVLNLPGQIKTKDENLLTMCDWKQGKEIHSYYSYLTLY